MVTISRLYQDIRSRLQEKESEDYAAFLARNVICHATGKDQAQLLLDWELFADDAVCDAARKDTDRLLEGEPLAYVLGEWEFYGLKLKVDNNVLIPRDDTCAVTELALKKAMFLGKGSRVLDLCTGSGCIGLAIASRAKDVRVILADISKEALAVAKQNIQRNRLISNVSCDRSDALGKPYPYLGKFDMIVSNPPYITTAEMETLDKSVKDFEPHLALHGGEDGLDFYRAIVKNYTANLNPGGYLCFEFGEGQGDAVCAILEENGYTILERSRDYNDTERAVIAQLRKKD